MNAKNKISPAAICILILASLALTSNAQATIITTSFNTTDGFTTGDFNPVTLTDGTFQTTFTGGQQQQMFDGPSYNVGPAGYLFVNGAFTGSFGNTTAGDGGAVDGLNDDTGLIDFNNPVTEVSFYAANRGNGAAVALNIFAADDATLLDTLSITQTTNRTADGAVLTTITSAGVGGLIGSIGINLPGPAGNPPYVLAIDTFSATEAAIPEPATATLACVGLTCLLARRRKHA